ncbi:MAG: hypothetical protein HYY13_02890 [Nitrospirae bacterium]|nr:hypothetical protein [Nitrospirota bacterium]
MPMVGNVQGAGNMGDQLGSSGVYGNRGARRQGEEYEVAAKPINAEPGTHLNNTVRTENHQQMIARSDFIDPPGSVKESIDLSTTGFQEIKDATTSVRVSLEYQNRLNGAYDQGIYQRVTSNSLDQGQP